jgi:hypothetical protein
MSDLEIELERVSLPEDILSAVRKELEAGGMMSGHIAVGDIKADAELIYFLWHDTADRPVSMLFAREDIDTAEGMSRAARSFLVKWRGRS